MERMRRFFPFLLPLCTALLCAGCGGNRMLPIPDRQWEAGAPREGWCGEASIQMAAQYYGLTLSQQAIHDAGHVSHADLWIENIPGVLHSYHLAFDAWPPRNTESTGPAFLTWIRSAVRGGYPVIVGSKIYPSDHLHWNVDHIMLVVGTKGDALVINTNMEQGQVVLTPEQLLQKQNGFSFVNNQGTFFGYAVKGFLK